MHKNESDNKKSLEKIKGLWLIIKLYSRRETNFTTCSLFLTTLLLLSWNVEKSRSFFFVFNWYFNERYRMKVILLDLCPYIYNLTKYYKIST